MNKENCDSIMDMFFELDKNERIPLKITLHLLSCKNCRTNIRMMTKAERILQKKETDISVADGATLFDVMAKLYPQKYAQKKVSLKSWLITGIILLLCMIFLTVISAYVIPMIQIYACIFSGLAISCYVAFFIAGNMDFFIKATSKNTP